MTARYVRDDPRGPVTRRRRRAPRHRGTGARAELSHAELVSTVAHELRSPLTSVKGFTATLLAKWDRFTDEQKRLMLETVDADADRVTRLITELLDISRIDSGRLAVRRQPVDLATVLHRHVAAMEARGEDPDRFVVRIADGLPEMWADPDKLDQVLGNLLENAVRHGAGTVTIVRRSRSARATARDRRLGDGERRGRGHPARSRATASSPGSGGRPPRRHRARPLHRQGPRRGARRPHRGRPRARRRREVPIRAARRDPRLRRLTSAPEDRRGPPPADVTAITVTAGLSASRLRARSPRRARAQSRAGRPLDSGADPNGARTHVRTEQVLRPRRGDPLNADEVEQARDDALAAIAAAADLDALKAVRLAHAGDRSPLALANREIGALPPAGQGRRRQAGRRRPAARSPRRWPPARPSSRPSATSGSWSRRPSTSRCPGTGSRPAPGTR